MATLDLQALSVRSSAERRKPSSIPQCSRKGRGRKNTMLSSSGSWLSWKRQRAHRAVRLCALRYPAAGRFFPVVRALAMLGVGRGGVSAVNEKNGFHDHEQAQEKVSSLLSCGHSDTSGVDPEPPTLCTALQRDARISLRRSPRRSGCRPDGRDDRAACRGIPGASLRSRNTS